MEHRVSHDIGMLLCHSGLGTSPIPTQEYITCIHLHGSVYVQAVSKLEGAIRDSSNSYPMR